MTQREVGKEEHIDNDKGKSYEYSEQQNSAEVCRGEEVQMSHSSGLCVVRL